MPVLNGGAKQVTRFYLKTKHSLGMVQMNLTVPSQQKGPALSC